MGAFPGDTHNLGVMGDSWVHCLRSSLGSKMRRDYLLKLGLTEGETRLLKDLIRLECVASSDIPFSVMTVCRLRRKLRRHGIRLSTVYGVGFRLTEDMKQKVATYAEAH